MFSYKSTKQKKNTAPDNHAKQINMLWAKLRAFSLKADVKYEALGFQR
jgi:hypothetical protein